MSDFLNATYDELDAEKLRRLNKFRYLSKDQLQNITPLWVTVQHKYLSEQINFDDYTIIDVPTSSLINKIYLLGLPTDKLFNNDVSDFRYITTLERWQNEQCVDPPTIYIEGESTVLLSISDGRHRLVLSYYMEVKTIPIVVRKEQVDTIIKIVYTN